MLYIHCEMRNKLSKTEGGGAGSPLESRGKVISYGALSSLIYIYGTPFITQLC